MPRGLLSPPPPGTVGVDRETRLVLLVMEMTLLVALRFSVDGGGATMSTTVVTYDIIIVISAAEATVGSSVTDTLGVFGSARRAPGPREPMSALPTTGNDLVITTAQARPPPSSAGMPDLSAGERERAHDPVDCSGWLKKTQR